MGAPQVRPAYRPERNSGWSASFRGVESSFCPGARRRRKRCSASGSTEKPAGKPSSVMPMAGEWDWPKMVSRRFSP